MISNRQNKQKKKKRWKFFVIFAVVFFAILLAINLYVVVLAKNRMFTRISNLPRYEFGLVMGTEPLRPDGSTNFHFFSRTDAAAEVYLSGKANRLLISGNKNNRGFDEVSEIKNQLLKKGVPESAMILDFDGKTTWESARRAAEVYHLQKVIIVTDTFHAPRSIYLCQHFGVDSVAFCAREEHIDFWSIRSQIREWLARVKAVFQVLIDGSNGLR
ncbi:MAG: ElyC/SanA/YdcF family protein [Verrucomicrobiota bacterium]|jgi:SanA protein